MNKELIKKAQELRARGFTTGEIADELNISRDTARWLILKAEEKVSRKAPTDIAIDWRCLSESASRLKYVSAIMADIASKYDVEGIVGIAVSGVPIATLMATLMNKELSFSVFHPAKLRKEKDVDGTISSNFASIYNKKVIIVDDVITSGRTVKEAVKVVKEQGAKPVAVVVLIDKKNLKEVDGVPVESLIKVTRVG